MVARCVGGPLDGLEVDVDDWTDDQIRGGVLHVVDGWAERADYEPDPDGDPLVWRYRGAGLY